MQANQQNPIVVGGGIFPVEKLRIIRVFDRSKIKKSIRAWDKSATAGGGATAAADTHSLPHRYAYEIIIEQEPGSGGKESFELTVRNLAGYIVYADKVTGSKLVRAEPLAAQVQAGNVFLIAGDHVDAFRDEMEMFPSGLHDDQVDAAAMAFARLADSSRYNSNYEEWV